MKKVHNVKAVTLLRTKTQQYDSSSREKEKKVHIP